MLFIRNSAIFFFFFEETDIPLPSYIPPSPQALIAATRFMAVALITDFRVCATLNYHLLAQFDHAKILAAKNPRNKGTKGIHLFVFGEGGKRRGMR